MQICIEGLAPEASKIIQPVVSVTPGYDVFAASHPPTLVTSTYGLGMEARHFCKGSVFQWFPRFLFEYRGLGTF